MDLCIRCGAQAGEGDYCPPCQKNVNIELRVEELNEKLSRLVAR